MITIEKTQINISALITLCGTLKEINSNKIVQISDDGKKVSIRDREENEYEDFRIDLKFLDEIFGEVVNQTPRTLIFENDAEKYLKNCSFACDYYRPGKHISDKYDHFKIFHNIHFEEEKDSENNVKVYFCRMFRIDDELFKGFNDCLEENKDLTLESNGAFNHIFKKLVIRSNNELTYKFTTENIEYHQVNDALFSIKDLLSNKGYDVSQIPNRLFFTMQQGGKLNYIFSLGTSDMILQAENYSLSVEFRKNCS